MRPSLDMVLLRTFHTIISQQQFLAASKQLHLSPSAISAQVRRLEAIAGGRLFERDNQTVDLTPLGRRFAIQSAELLQTHDRIVSQFGQPQHHQRIRLGISEDYVSTMLAYSLPILIGDYPDIELAIETANSGQLLERLQQGALDLAVVVDCQRVPVEAQLQSVTVSSTQPIWAGAWNYRYDADQPLPLALHATGCPYRSLALDLLEQAAVAWRCAIITSASRAFETAIETGWAVGIIDSNLRTSAMRELSVAEGFPALPAHELRLMFAAGMDRDQPAIVLLSQLISDSLRLTLRPGTK